MTVKTILLNIFYGMISLVIYTIMFLSIDVVELKTFVNIIGFISLGLMVLIIFSWFKLTGSFFNLYMFFLIFLLIFNFGQFIAVTINGFDLSVLNSYVNVINEFSTETLLKATFIAYFSVLCLQFGGLIMFKKNNIKSKYENIAYVSYCKYIGIILLMISFIPMLYYDYLYIQHSITVGYSLSSLSVNYGIIDDLSRVAKVAIIFLMLGYKNNLKLARIIYFTSVVYSVFKIYIIGQRGYEFIFLIIITYIYYKYITSINISKLLKIGFCTIFLLSMMNSVVYIRETTSKVTIDRVVNNIINNNLVVEILAEFGSTFYTTGLIIKNVPDTIDYSYGLEYASAALSVLPNIGNINYYLNEINIINKMNYMSNGKIGIGGSFIGEAYYNFSYLIFIFMIIAGYLFYHIYLSIYTNKKINSFKLGISLAFYQNLIWLCRDNIMSFPRKCIFEILLPVIIYLILSEIGKKGNKSIKGADFYDSNS